MLEFREAAAVMNYNHDIGFNVDVLAHYFNSDLGSSLLGNIEGT